MMLKMEPNPYPHPHQTDILPDPFSSLPLVTYDVDQKTSLGFMELLGFQDHYYSNSYPTSSIFDMNTTSFQPLPSPSSLTVEMEVPTSAYNINNSNNNNGDLDDNNRRDDDQEFATVDEEIESSVVLNGQPSSPNSSSICTSPAHQRLQKQCIKEKKAIGGDETKAKKKKKEKAPRFAFMTRTDIDHLDDGYRWRKYGQKAVKNSHFPRSYFRCTSASCNVKKRVERCMGDPSYVITTYEGQHNHPVGPNSAPLVPSFNHLFNNTTFAATSSTTTATPPAILKLDQGGLLQDMLPCHH